MSGPPMKGPYDPDRIRERVEREGRERAQPVPAGPEEPREGLQRSDGLDLPWPEAGPADTLWNILVSDEATWDNGTPRWPMDEDEAIAFIADVRREAATTSAPDTGAEERLRAALAEIAENSYHAATRHGPDGSPTCGTCMARAALSGGSVDEERDSDE